MAGVLGCGYTRGLELRGGMPAGGDSFLGCAGEDLVVGAPVGASGRRRAGVRVARALVFGSGCGTTARRGLDIGRTGAGVGLAVTVLSTLVDCSSKQGYQP